MPASNLMISETPALRTDTTVGEAMEVLSAHRIGLVPVVDGEGRFAGLFDVHQMMKLLLPRAATMDHGVHSLDYVGDHGETLHDFARRMREIDGDPIGDYLTTDTPVVHPDTSTMETLRSLYHRPSMVPVVERESGRLLGITTCWEMLAHIAAHRDDEA